MNFCVVILSLLFMKEVDSGIAVRKFVHQKDMSEHCRRRVVPSVFLGKHVVDANSQILHFSRLQLPYSCSISVRTEFGNNIILVIQLASEESLVRSCGPDHNQLLIYEIGETFGGYWGALPDDMMRNKPQNDSKFYTLKTTQSTTKARYTDDYNEDDEEKVEKVALTRTRTTGTRNPDSDFFRVEVPLVNVSGDLGFDDISPQRAIETDELFDLIYDVTPRSGVAYDTSILPLVQFSMKKQKDNYNNGVLLEPKYELDYNLGKYTPDERITYSTLYNKKLTRRYKSTKTLNFRRKNKGFNHGKTNSRKNFWTTPTKVYESVKTSMLPTINEDILSIIYNDTFNNSTSWDFIDHLFKSFNLTTTMLITRKTTDTTRVDNEASSFKYEQENNLTTVKFSPSSEEKTTLLQGTNSTYKSHETEIISTSQDISESTEDEVRVYFTATDSAVPQETGSLVNHQSFENVVQAAPVIAGLLNKTNIINSTLNKNKGPKKGHIRKKRYIKALDIENARPRVLTTRMSMTETTEKVYRYSDMQDLAQLVELQDDEIQGRVSLRYLRKYVGSALFNICQFYEPKARQVYLFNSSRIVIAISNFTMERMTLVVTPARTVPNSFSKCPPAHLECQVAGTRVCIDSTNECDGVPNCGAYDIYDEDRLRCGWSLGLQHNVCLAACTFLAVILTLLYTVHYWLKRCVPMVSQAFFIYADTSENILYLDSIMHSPNDNDDYSKLFYQPNIFDDQDDFVKEQNQESICQRLLTCLATCLLCKKKKVEKSLSDEIIGQDLQKLQSIPKKLYSFTELELRNMAPITKDATVQTGSSLEVSRHKNINNQEKPTIVSSDNFQPIVNIKTSKEDSELNLLKRIRNLKLSPQVSTVSNDKVTSKLVDVEETELHSTVYEPNIPAKTVEISHKVPAKSKAKIAKHLRFDEDITTIPRLEDDSNIDVTETHRNVSNLEEVPSTSGNEFRQYWRNGKNKKGQKKTHLSLR